MKYLAALFLLLLAVVLFFPANLGEIQDARRVRTRGDLIQLVTAVRAYHSEYGKYPEAQVPGMIETESENAALIKMLSGYDAKKNAKGFVFFDIRGASSKSGSKPASGAFVDAWGNYYRVRFDADENGSVNNPYDEEPHQLQSDVIAWSVGKDGMQDRRGNSASLKTSDDIVSWK